MTECSICLEDFKSPVELKCKHSFCLNCIIKCNDNLCPLCRVVIINKNDIEDCCKCTVNIKTPFKCKQYNRKGKCRICNKKSIEYFKKNYFKNKFNNMNEYDNIFIYNTLV